jgi:hypothetical protein
MADRIGFDTVETVFPSAARIATPTDVEFVRGPGVRGIALFLDVTAVGVTPSVQITVDMKSVVGNDWVRLFTGVAVVAAVNRAYVIYPGAVETFAEATMELQGVPVPVHFRVGVFHGNGVTITYSLELHALE